MAGDYMIPFDTDGNQLDYPLPTYGAVPRTVWMANAYFGDTLTYDGWGRGRSSVTFYWRRSNGKRVTMFLTDMDTVLPLMRDGKIRGTFRFCKRGQNYGCQMAAFAGHEKVDA